MTLYELHAYPTQRYDRAREQRIRFKDSWFRKSRVMQWIADYLDQVPDGKIVVWEIENVNRRNERHRKLFTATCNGVSYQ